ncbi:hypothetical protein ACE6H2_006351 [Prunus campanulata]
MVVKCLKWCLEIEDTRGNPIDEFGIVFPIFLIMQPIILILLSGSIPLTVMLIFGNLTIFAKLYASVGNQAAIGFIIRDDNAHVVLTSAKKIGRNSIIVAECLTLRDGLAYAVLKGWSKLLVEGDSKLVIDSVLKVMLDSLVH